MEISKEQIEKIATLAKLELSEAEKNKYQEQFADILNFVDLLKEVDVSDLDVLGVNSDFKNQLRDDEVFVCSDDERIVAIDQATEIENDQFKVKRVL